MLKFSLRRPADPPPHWHISVIVKLLELPKAETAILSFPFSRPRWQRSWGLFWRLHHEKSGGTCGWEVSPTAQLALRFHTTQTAWSQPLEVRKSYEISGGWDGAQLYGLIYSQEDGRSEEVSCPLDHIPPVRHYEAPFPGIIEEVAIYDH